MNEKLWDEKAGWFVNLYPDGSKHLVMSYHQFDLLDSGILSDQAKRGHDRPSEGGRIPGATRTLFNFQGRPVPIGILRTSIGAGEGNTPGNLCDCQRASIGWVMRTWPGIS